MSERPKIAFYWCASCGGCEESVVDLAEDILGVLDAVDIVFWPVAMDFKKSDVESMEDGSILVTLINGAVRTSEQEEMARLLRRKSRIVIAYGSCAHLGGIPSLANQFGRDEILDFVYRDAPTVVNPDDIRPLTACAENGRTVTLPQFRNLVRTLDQVIDVDYYLPRLRPRAGAAESRTADAAGGKRAGKRLGARPRHRAVRCVSPQGNQTREHRIHPFQTSPYDRRGPRTLFSRPGNILYGSPPPGAAAARAA
jgi:coenzyme F420-reducing hydrogenase gamma subunit